MPTEESKRRQRTQKSCQPCRVGKLRCDRELPCGECTKRLREPACIYTQQVQDSLVYRSQARQMRQKLENLEKVVRGLREGEGAPTVRTPDTATPKMYVKPPQGTLKITHDEETFVGPTHWESIVNDIAEVKAHLDDYAEVHDTPHASSHESSSPGSLDPESSPDLFFHGRAGLSVQDLINSLPAKAQCDRMVSAWFRSMDNYKHIVHIPTFQRQYAHFWKDHSAATPVWLALLFNILALGAQYLVRTPAVDSSAQPGGMLHRLAAHAIILADYSKPKMYILEALVLYIRFGQMQADESQLKLWLTLGLVTRLATRMGIFRDATLSDGVLPFVAEMRRRLWLCICYMDILFSYHIGLVSVIQGLPANAAPPANIDDADFGPDSVSLPAARPMDERTNVTYTIILGQLTGVFAETVTISNAVTAPSDAEVARLDEKTRRIGDSMPGIFQMRPLDESFGDPPSLIMERIRLDLVSTKNTCVLYRRFLGSDQHLNRRKCTDAAMRILETHAVLDEAVQPTGQLETCHFQEIRDCMDCFILAGIITGVELSNAHRLYGQGEDQCYSGDQLDRMRQLLLRSCDIWTRWSFAPRKARRAAGALKQMLDSHGDVAVNASNGSSGLTANGASIESSDDTGLFMNVDSDTATMTNLDLPDASFPDIFTTPWEDQGMNWGKWDSIMNTGEATDAGPYVPQGDDLLFP